MKMLGQDLLTQEEFDAFKKNEFDPFVSKVKTFKNWVIGLAIANSVSLLGLAILMFR